MMSKEQILRDVALSPLAKLILLELADRPAGVVLAKDIGRALGCHGSAITEETPRLRARGLIDRIIKGVHVPLDQLRLSDDTRAAWRRSSQQKAAS